MRSFFKQRVLEVRYRHAQNYDRSWVVPPRSFKTWRKGQSRPPGESPGETIFDRLVKLGVLEKVNGPVSAKDELEGGL